MSYKVTKNQKLNFKTELGQPRINHHSQPNTASPKLMYVLWGVCVCVCVCVCVLSYRKFLERYKFAKK